MNPKVSHAIGRVSRADIADNAAVWMLYASMFTIFAIGEIGLALIVPELSLSTCGPFALFLGAIAATAWVTKPPALGTKRNHVSIVAISIAVALGMVAFRPDTLIPLSPMMFMGPYAASRLTSRSQIAAHCAAASVILALPAFLGLLDTSTKFGVAILIPAIWLLSICVIAVLEAAEAEGAELELLVRRDPLTGIGNRRLLDEQLVAEIDRHRLSGRQLSVLALDLNGFKALNDAAGHAAGDVALQEVASALRAIARTQDTLARQGGDEFCMLLTDSTHDQARFVATAIRTNLAGLADGVLPITTGIGIATFPADGEAAEGLLAVADARLADDKARTDPQLDPRHDVAATAALFASARVASASQPNLELVPVITGTIGQVTRRELTRNPYMWAATGLLFVLVAALSTGCALLLPEAPRWSFGLALGSAVVGATIVFTREGPAMGTKTNHALLAAVSITSAAFIAAFPQAAGAGLGAAIFIGPFTAVRLNDRRQIVAHLAAASVVYVALIPAGLTDRATSLSLGIMLLGIWGLGVACIAVLEAAERQGEELEQLVRRDPLTGLGNRRMLTEQLAAELARHARNRRPFTVLALDLNGFKPLNDRFGHAAGDQLLIDVARAIEREVGEDDTVVRQGGDEFCVVLAETDGERAATVAQAIRRALTEIEAHGLTITTGVGIASYPTEATSAEALLEVADELLRVSKETDAARLRHVRRRPAGDREAA